MTERGGGKPDFRLAHHQETEGSAPSAATHTTEPATWRPWTTQEERLLKEIYPSAGAQACLRALPGRTLPAIYSRAHILKLQTPPDRRSGRQRHTSSPDLDAQIKLFYLTPPKPGDTARFAARMHRPHWWVKFRASQLGCAISRVKPSNWSEEEDDLLREWAHLHSRSIALKFKERGTPRTLTAIVVRMKRLGVCHRQARLDAGLHTMQSLAALLGVDPSTVKRWISMEGLPATAAGTRRTPEQGGDTYRIDERRLRAWLRDHEQLIDLRKVDRSWFFEIAFRT